METMVFLETGNHVWGFPLDNSVHSFFPFPSGQNDLNVISNLCCSTYVKNILETAYHNRNDFYYYQL